jgi:hypothetical protein
MAVAIDRINYERQMDLSDSHVKALADALTAAGFGPVKAAKVEALRDAADAYQTPHFGTHAGHWLRARAVALEG